MVFKNGQFISEKLKQEPIPVVPVLKDLKKIILKPAEQKFNVHPKARLDLPKIADNELLRFEAAHQADWRPLRVGVLFSGGPAAGGHNVVAGLYDALKSINPASEVIGFANGPEGLLNADGRILTSAEIESVRNQGGFYLLGTSRTKYEKAEDLEKCHLTLDKFNLDGLVVIGGDDSNTNAAYLANYLKVKNSKTVVVGLPKTIDGDLAYLPYLETSFGFYTASRIYSEMVGNICRDLPSSRKIWHFVKLMGRSASWITLEVAFQTQPNVALIGEEIKAKKMSLAQIANEICTVIVRRHAAGKKYGIVLIPEGIVEFIPEVKELISEINKVIVKIGNENFLKMNLEERKENVLVELSQEKERLFVSFPQEVQNGLLSGLDPHGNVQVSQIASDILLMELCREKLSSGIEVAGQNQKIKITTQTHFYGYDGRCGYPTWFDATYTYNLGRAAAVLVAQQKTGYMAVVTNLAEDVEKWQALALPMTGMMSVEERKGREILVIAKYLVNLDSPAFKEFEKNRPHWSVNDDYLCPGPIQYWGPEELVKSKAITLLLNS
jgi:pyrophosphate--fructose-6-phosphate 1-phosphotransferase